MDNKTAHKAQTNSLTTVKKEGEEGGGGEEGKRGISNRSSKQSIVIMKFRAA